MELGLWYTGFSVGLLGITAGIYEMIKVRQYWSGVDLLIYLKPYEQGKKTE